ncbi:MAG: radical SAM family heme chaperone HemW [Firmicutes bacterium]|nr:radical SAM family heme chaperone HemW [Bacillota bacterium]
MSSGVYIHIPFCQKKCYYCNFNSFDNIEHLKEKYINALIYEIKNSSMHDYDSVFIGGGTPTCVPIHLLLDVVRLVAKKGCEFTIEANPATISEKGLFLLRKAGVNRISLGLQSANDSELLSLGRLHTFDGFLNSFKNARRAGFDNINIDLMFGLPEQTIDSLKHSLNAVADLAPEHISCYCLSVEEGTPFYNMPLNLPDEETARQMYLLCVEFFKKHGFNHYEISNFAKDGFECKHNLKYWERKQYYGFGAGAHSLLQNIRYKNSNNVCEYIDSNVAERTVLSQSEIKNEYIFLALRKTNGIELADYNAIFCEDFLKKYDAQILKYKDYCTVKDGRFYLNLNGLTVSNTIIADFLE